MFDIKCRKYKIVYLFTSCKKSGPTNQVINMINNLDRNVFSPILVTLYEEDNSSVLNKFKELGVEHHFVSTSKFNIIIGKTEKLKEQLEKISPDIIYTDSVFPSFAVARMKKYKHVMVLRNYIYDDYPTKFGKILGSILANMDLFSMKRSHKTVTCSRSLSQKYEDELKLQFEYIQNGVDISLFSRATMEERRMIRNQLGLPDTSFVWIYTGQFIERKNIPFLLDNYIRANNEDDYLILLGDGPEFTKIKEKYHNYKNILFLGTKDDVSFYLKASDCYISCSKSEGLPNGVLEAMSTGVAVLLSDIEQHKEILDVNPSAGCLYKQGSSQDFLDKMMYLRKSNILFMGNAAFELAHNKFSAKIMSENYQSLFRELIGVR